MPGTTPAFEPELDRLLPLASCTYPRLSLRASPYASLTVKSQVFIALPLRLRRPPRVERGHLRSPSAAAGNRSRPKTFERAEWDNLESDPIRRSERDLHEGVLPRARPISAEITIPEQVLGQRVGSRPAHPSEIIELFRIWAERISARSPARLLRAQLRGPPARSRRHHFGSPTTRRLDEILAEPRASSPIRANSRNRRRASLIEQKLPRARGSATASTATRSPARTRRWRSGLPPHRGNQRGGRPSS